MPTLLLGILIVLKSALAFAQPASSGSSYEPATITGVKPYNSVENANPETALYEVSVKARRITYVVLTTSPDHSPTILYTVGRQILVHIGENAITWNDILGQSHEVPIQSRSLIAETAGTQRNWMNITRQNRERS